MENLKFCKVRAVKSPVRAHPEDAGIDFYFPNSITKDELNDNYDKRKDWIIDAEQAVENKIVSEIL